MMGNENDGKSSESSPQQSGSSQPLVGDSLQNIQPAAGQYHIGRVAVRAPPFWKENPALWFRQLESQFHINAITSSETKYHIAVAALDTAVINQVSDVVMNPPAANIMYETLKSRLQDRFAESEERRFKKLLNNIELGDKKPSHLWREMRELAGTRVEDGFLRSLWLQRLPAQIQAILSTDDGDIPRLLVTADRIHEVIDVRGVVQAVTSLPSARSSGYVVPTSESTIDNACASDFQRLSNQVNELSLQLAALSSGNYNHRSGSNDRRNQSRSRSRSKKQYDECWYHFRYGKNAKKCNKPCTYKPEN